MLCSNCFLTFLYQIFDFPKTESPNLCSVPISQDGWWLRSNGLAHAIHTECRYCLGAVWTINSTFFPSNLAQEIRVFCFAKKKSTVCAIIYFPPPFDSMIKRKVALDRHVRDEQIVTWTRMQPSVLGIKKIPATLRSTVEGIFGSALLCPGHRLGLSVLSLGSIHYRCSPPRCGRKRAPWVVALGLRRTPFSIDLGLWIADPICNCLYFLYIFWMDLRSTTKQIAIQRKAILSWTVRGRNWIVWTRDSYGGILGHSTVGWRYQINVAWSDSEAQDWSKLFRFMPHTARTSTSTEKF